MAWTTARAGSTSAVLGISLAIAGPALGETPPLENGAQVSPTEILVQGARREDRGVLVSVVDDETIERQGATSVAEALERLPAFSTGANSRGERILSLRGFDQRQLAVFVDGVPVYVPYDGQLDLGKFPVDMVDRVTVVKGAGSLLYGPNGLGGAVNIVTREPTERPSLRTTTEISPWSATRASAVGTARLGPVGGLVGVGFQSVRYVPMSAGFASRPNEDGGRRDNSDKLGASLAAKWIWDLTDAHRLSLSASRFAGHYGVPPATRDFTVRYWRWTDWSSSTLGLSHAYRSARWQTEELVYVSAFSNTLDSYDDASYSTQLLPKAFQTTYDDAAIGGVVRMAYTAPLGSTRKLGLRTWTGIKHDGHVSTDAAQADPIAVSTNTVTTSAQGELELMPPWLRATLGAQVDGELPGAPPTGPRPGSSAAVGPLATLSVLPSRAWSVTASAAARTRFPTLKERFSTVFGAREANPLLGPEHAWNFALDVVFKAHRSFRIATGLFDSELRDLIAPVLVRPQTEQMRNVNRARFIGAEAEIQWTPLPWLDLSAGWMFLYARSGAGLDEPVPYRPDHKGLFSTTVIPWPGISLTAVMRHIGAQDFQISETGVWGRIGAYQLFDARAEWAFQPSLRAWVRATNLTDANVEARYSFPEAGRQFFFGLGSEVGS